MKPLFRSSFLLIALSGVPISHGADSEYRLERSWEIAISGNTKEPPNLRGIPKHYVAAAQFSDDEKRVAVSVGVHGAAGDSENHLFVISVDNPTGEWLQVDYANPLPSSRIAWSADGRLIAYSSSSGIALLRTGDRRICVLEKDWFDFTFLHDQLLVLRPFEYRDPGRVISSYLIFYSPNCVEVRRAPIHGKAFRMDASANRNRIVVKIENGDALVMDGDDLSILDRWRPVHSEVRFINEGNAVCAAAYDSIGPPPECHVVGNTGETVSPRLRCGWPFATASRGNWAIAGDAKYSYHAFAETQSWDLRRIVIYDYLTGRSSLSLAPHLQAGIGARFEGPQNHTPCAIALSPSGQFLIEGCNDTLRLYRISTAPREKGKR